MVVTLSIIPIYSNTIEGKMGYVTSKKKNDFNLTNIYI